MRQKNYVDRLIGVNVRGGMFRTLLLLPFWVPSIAVAAELSAPAELIPATSTSATSTSDEFCILHNSLQQDDRTILGDIPDSPYVVVVPGQGDELLLMVRQCVPDAFQTNLRLGAYVRAGAFPNQRSAERLSRHLRRSLQLDARVMYLP